MALATKKPPSKDGKLSTRTVNGGQTVATKPADIMVGLASGKPKKKRKAAEEAFQKQVIDLAHLRGYKVAHFRPMKFTKKDGTVAARTPVSADGAGFPDLIMVKEGNMVVAELKVKPNKPNDEQKDWIARFKSAYCAAFVWYPEDWETIANVLR